MAEARDAAPFDPAPRIAGELDLTAAAVRTVVKLLAEGASVPFIARYRKEQTGGLDEVAVRAIEEKGAYYRDLDERKTAVLAEIDSQGKLTPELRRRIEDTWVKSVLEDIYLPFKPKRRTRAMIARERGLGPLAKRLREQPLAGDPAADAAAFVDPAKEVLDVKAALAGARDIVAEELAEDVAVRGYVRDVFRNEGVVVCEAMPGKASEPTKFETYYGFRGDLRSIPSHRFLAIRRGETEGVLRSEIEIEKDKVLLHVCGLARVVPASPFAGELRLRGHRGARPAPLSVARDGGPHRAEAGRGPRGHRHLRGEPAEAPAPACPREEGRPRDRPRAAHRLQVRRRRRHGEAARAHAHQPRAGGPRARAREADARRAAPSSPPVRRRGGQRDARARDGRLLPRRAEGVEARGGGGDGERVGGERVLGQRRRARGVPRPRPHRARRDLHRPATAGPARRAREGRPEGHRRGPVPARRLPAARSSGSSRRSSRAASTPSASSSTRRARRS